MPCKQKQSSGVAALWRLVPLVTTLALCGLSFSEPLSSSHVDSLWAADEVQSVFRRDVPEDAPLVAARLSRREALPGRKRKSGSVHSFKASLPMNDNPSQGQAEPQSSNPALGTEKPKRRLRLIPSSKDLGGLLGNQDQSQPKSATQGDGLAENPFEKKRQRLGEDKLANPSRSLVGESETPRFQVGESQTPGSLRKKGSFRIPMLPRSSLPKEYHQNVMRKLAQAHEQHLRNQNYGEQSEPWREDKIEQLYRDANNTKIRHTDAGTAMNLLRLHRMENGLTDQKYHTKGQSDETRGFRWGIENGRLRMDPIDDHLRKIVQAHDRGEQFKFEN